MKRSTKVISIILIFFLIIAFVIIGRTMIGNHFKKKFSKRPPPGIIVTEVINEKFAEKLETFGTAISSKTKTFKIRKDDISGELKLKEKVKKGDIILNLISGNVIAPFSGVLGYTGLTEDIFVSDNIFIITLDDNSTIYSDIKVPESYAPFIKKGLPVEARVSSYKNKIFKGKIFYSPGYDESNKKRSNYKKNIGYFNKLIDEKDVRFILLDSSEKDINVIKKTLKKLFLLLFIYIFLNSPK